MRKLKPWEAKAPGGIPDCPMRILPPRNEVGCLREFRSLSELCFLG
jgi:hypothetical protein